MFKKFNLIISNPFGYEFIAINNHYECYKTEKTIAYIAFIICFKPLQNASKIYDKTLFHPNARWPPSKWFWGLSLLVDSLNNSFRFHPQHSKYPTKQRNGSLPFICIKVPKSDGVFKTSFKCIFSIPVIIFSFWVIFVKIFFCKNVIFSKFGRNRCASDQHHYRRKFVWFWKIEVRVLKI